MENQEQSNAVCPKCGSHHLMRDVGVLNDGGKVKLAAFPGSQTQRAYGVTPLLAAVCGDCGYTELYVDEYKEMWEAWHRRNA